ncbi:MAG: efflux RND transporter periplasmic adaptor subunit, partial [Planctomycetota bacterium]
FTEPFRRIDLSSDESGAIATLMVDEGDQIQKDDVVCNLDTSVQEIQVEIAKHMAESKSSVVAAEETYEKRQAIDKRITELQQNGHATDSEKIRSDMELSIAKARYLSAVEDFKVREIEYRRALMQLERRTIRAPFSGTVSKIHKRVGEFLSPVHPEIITLIQTDQLIAKFNVLSAQVANFEVGKKFQLHMINGKTVEATVYRIGVLTEAQSGTIEVKMLIENKNGEIRAGEFLTLEI